MEAAAKYGECCKSLLRFWGKADGCQEYKECAATPLNCETCGCHRNFHRKVEVAAYEKLEVVCKKCQRNLGLQCGGRTSRNIASATQGSNSPCGFTKCEVLSEKPSPSGLIKRKPFSLLEDFFRDKVLDETSKCVEELKSPEYHPEVVRVAISLALEKVPPCEAQVSLLIEHMFDMNVLTEKDIGSGCVLYAGSLCVLAIYIPKVLELFGTIIGNFFMAGAMDLEVVNEILAEVKDIYYKKAVFAAAMKVVDSYFYGEDLLESEGFDFAAWKGQL